MPNPPTRRLRAAVTLLGVIAVAAPPATPAQGVHIKLAAWPQAVLMDTLRQDHELSAAPDSVYQAVLRAFADVGIPTGRTDGRAGIIGSERFERQRALGNVLLSKLFDCGEGPAGPNADLFRLEIAVVAWVAPAGNGTKLGMAAVASGRDVSGVFRNPKECASTGALELKVLDRVSKLVGGS